MPKNLLNNDSRNRNVLRSCIEQNAAVAINEEEYREQYDRLYDQFENPENKRDKLSRKLSIAQSDAAKLDEVIRIL